MRIQGHKGNCRSWQAGLVPAVICTVLLVTGCDRSRSDGAGPHETDKAAATDSLIQADLAFAELALKEGLAAGYLKYLAEDAVQLPDGGLPISGRDAIYDNVVLATDSGEFQLTWEPIAAEVSAAGDLGYTWGAYYYETLDDAGEPVSMEGKYVNIWVKDAGGEWKIVLDMSNQNAFDYGSLDDLEGELADLDEAEQLD